MPTRTATAPRRAILRPAGIVLACALGASGPAPARAEPQIPPKSATWTYSWEPAPGEAAAPAVAICPLEYDKVWAYAVEIDDGPASTLTTARPLLARFEFTDAPPGLRAARPSRSSAGRR